MASEDEDGDEFCEKDFRGIVAGAETSIFNIKKQLQTVQTLRTELNRKESIVSALNNKICDLERDALLSSEYYHENRILIERSYQLERAVETSKNEQFVLAKQIVDQSQRFEILKEELDSISKIASDARGHYDNQQRELSIVKAKLDGTTEALHESQHNNQLFQIDLREAELTELDIRNDAKTKCNNAEMELQHQKDKCSLLERNLADSEGRVKDHELLIDRWITKHNMLESRLSEKTLEVEHWQRLYTEQESVVDTLTVVTNEMRSHQTFQDENLKQAMMTAAEKANNMQIHVQDMEAAMTFLSSNVEHLKNTASRIDHENHFSNDKLFQNSQLNSMIFSFKENFSTKFGSKFPEFQNFISNFCKIFEEFCGVKESKLKLSLELEKVSNSTETAADVLRKMESKYIIMKDQVKEAKFVMQHQQTRYVDLVDKLNTLSEEKGKSDLITEQEKLENLRIIEELSEIIKLNESIREEDAKKMEMIKENSIIEAKLKLQEERIKIENSKNENLRNGNFTNENSVDDENDSMNTNIKINRNNHDNHYSFESVRKMSPSDEEDVKILHETLTFVETLALRATELESRYEEVLKEKKLLKKMCLGYDQLKAEIIQLTNTCHAQDIQQNKNKNYRKNPEFDPIFMENNQDYSTYSTYGNTSINENSHNTSHQNQSLNQSYNQGQGHNYNYNQNQKLNQSNTSFSRDSLSKTLLSSHTRIHPPHTQNTKLKLKLYVRTRPLTLRVVAIHILAGLRLVRILFSIRNNLENSKKNQNSIGVRKIIKKVPLTVYQQSLALKFGRKEDPNLLNYSLLDLISSRSSSRSGPGSESNSNIHSTQRKSDYDNGVGGRDGGRGSSVERDRESGVNGGQDGTYNAEYSVDKIRMTICNMSEVIAGLRAKELLLYLAENRYGEQQKDLLVALGEAEETLREKDYLHVHTKIGSSSSASQYNTDNGHTHTQNQNHNRHHAQGYSDRLGQISGSTDRSIYRNADTNADRNGSGNGSRVEVGMGGNRAAVDIMKVVQRERAMEDILERERLNVKKQEREREMIIELEREKDRERVRNKERQQQLELEREKLELEKERKKATEKAEMEVLMEKEKVLAKEREKEREREREENVANERMNAMLEKEREKVREEREKVRLDAETMDVLREINRGRDSARNSFRDTARDSGRESERERERASERPIQKANERVGERVNERGIERPYDRSELGTSTSFSSSLLHDEGDTVLGDIKKALYSPYVTTQNSPIRRQSREIEMNKSMHTSTPSFFSSFTSPPRERTVLTGAEEYQYTPRGSRVFTQKTIAGDEKHVSIALRAYAMSVVEEERIINSPIMNRKYLNYSYPMHSDLMIPVDSSNDTLVPLRMYSDDEIIEMSQTN